MTLTAIAALLGIYKIWIEKKSTRVWKIEFVISIILFAITLLEFYSGIISEDIILNRMNQTENEAKRERAEISNGIESINESLKYISQNETRNEIAKKQTEYLGDIVLNAVDSGLSAYEAGDYEKATTHMYYAIQGSRGDSVQLSNLYLLMGTAEFEKNNMTSAINLYDSSISYNRNNFMAWTNRGAQLAKGNNYSDAILSYDSSIFYFAQNPLAWESRGVLLHKLNRLDEAIISMDSAMSLGSNEAYFWIARGNLLEDCGYHKKAIENYNTMIENGFSGFGAWYNRGALLLKLQLFNEAAISFDSALNYKYDISRYLLPENQKIIFLNSAEMKLYNFNENIYNNYVYKAWYGMAISLYELKYYIDALNAFDSAISLKPDFLDA